MVWNKGLTKKDKRVAKYCKKNKKTQFKKGHKLSIGKNNGNWKGGKIISSDGYVLIRKPSHPRAKSGYVFEHILVMEKHIGRCLCFSEVVHHINFIRSDNRIENLELMTNSQHITFHNNKRWKNE